MTWAAFSWTLTGIILACLVLAAMTDLADRIIPNPVVLVVLVCGLGLRLPSGPGPFSISLLTAILILAGLGLLASHDLLGWGDAKLISAVTIAVPASRVILMLLAIVIAGGVVSCLYLAARAVLKRIPPPGARAEETASSLGRIAKRERARIRADEPMPYALAVLGGVAYGLANA